MKYFIYCRKSSEGDERQALSLPAQERELTELSIENNLDVVEIFQESKSARTPNKRPIFQKMIARIKKGEAQGIICWHINRLSRNWEEAGMLMQMLTEHKIEEIITPERKITIDNSNDIVLGVEFGQSSQYSKELSLNIKRGIREKRHRGQYPRSAPHFYKNIGTSKFNRNITPNETTSQYFEEWIDYIIENECSLLEATNWLENKGIRTSKGKPFAKSTIHLLLQNPVYCGRFRNEDSEGQKGEWKPLITESKFRKLQKVLGNRRKPRFYSHTKGYRGLMTCSHCGCAITCTHKIKEGKSYIYYHCTKRRGSCPQPSLTEKELENQLFEKLSEIQLDEKAYELILKTIKERHSDLTESFEVKKKEYQKELNEVDEMINELTKMRLKKQIVQEEYESQKKELTEKKQNLKEKLEDNDLNQDNWVHQLEIIVELCFNIEDFFNNSSIGERSKLIKIVGEKLTLENGVLRWNFKKPFDLMLIVNFDENRPEWWRWRESNPRPGNQL